jgi:hypothetical protein
MIVLLIAALRHQVVVLRTAHHGELLKVGFEVAQSSVAKYKQFAGRATGALTNRLRVARYPTPDLAVQSV